MIKIISNRFQYFFLNTKINIIKYLLNFNKYFIKIYLLYFISTIFLLCFSFINTSCITYCMEESGYIADNSDSNSEDLNLNDNELILNNTNYPHIKTTLYNEELTFFDIMHVNEFTQDLNEKLYQLSHDKMVSLNLETCFARQAHQAINIERVIKIFDEPAYINFINDNIIREDLQNSFSKNEKFVLYENIIDSIDYLMKDLNFSNINENDQLKIQNYKNINIFIKQEQNTLLNSNKLKYYEEFLNKDDLFVKFNNNYQLVRVFK